MRFRVVASSSSQLYGSDRVADLSILSELHPVLSSYPIQVGLLAFQFFLSCIKVIDLPKEGLTAEKLAFNSF
jgi:hypothetical protein